MVDVPELGTVKVSIIGDLTQFTSAEAEAKTRSKNLSDQMTADAKKISDAMGVNMKLFANYVKSGTGDAAQANKVALDAMGVNWTMFNRNVRAMEAQRAAEARQTASEITRANREASQSSEKAARDAMRVTKENQAAVRQLINTFDVMHAAELRTEDALREINRLKGMGLISDEKAIVLQKEAANQLERYKRSQQSSSGLKGHQLTNLSYQANDVISGLMMGQNPGQIAAQQGGQIFQILQQSEGGVMRGLAGVGGAVGKFLINPFTLAVGAIGGAAAALGALTARAQDTDAVIRKFTGLSEVFGSGGPYDPKKIEASARALDVYGGKFKDIQAELQTSMTQGISAGALESFGRTAEHVAKVTGVDVKQAADSMARGFTGGWEQVKALDQQMNFLSLTEAKHIKSLFEDHRASEARNESYRIFAEKYGKAYNDTLSQADLLTNSLASSWNRMVEAMGNFGPVTAATSAIGGLIDQMTNWMLRYAQITNLAKPNLEKRHAMDLGDSIKAFNDKGKAQAEYDEYMAKNGDHINEPSYRYSYAMAKKKLDEASGKKVVADARLFESTGALTALNAPANTGDIMTKGASDKAAFYAEGKGKKAPKEKLSDDEREVKRAIESVEKLTAATKVQSQARADNNQLIAMGVITTEDANRAAEITAKTSQYQDALDAEAKTTKTDLKDKVAALTIELKKQQDLEIESSIWKTVEAQNKQNAELDLELSLLGATNRERAVAIAQAQAIRSIKEAGGDPNSDAGLAQIAGAVAGANKGADIQSGTFMKQQSDALRAQTQEWDIARATMYMTRQEAAAYRKEQELLNQATNQGIDLTKAQKDQIHDMATAYSQGTAAMEKAQAIQDLIKTGSQTLEQAIEDIALNGKKGNEVLWDMVKALDAAVIKAALLGEGPLAQLFGTSKNGGLLGMIGNGTGGGSGGGLSGIISGLFGGGNTGPAASTGTFGMDTYQLHDGGVAALHGMPRIVHPSVFQNAPKFHEGRLKPNELPAILEDDEVVLNRGQQSALRKKMGGQTVHIHYHGIQDAESVKRNERQLANGAARALGQTGRG